MGKKLLLAVRRRGVSLSRGLISERRDVLEDELFYRIGHRNVGYCARGDTWCIYVVPAAVRIKPAFNLSAWFLQQ